VNSTEDAKVLFGVIGFRKLLSKENNPPIQSVIDANVVPRLIYFLSRADVPKIQFEACWCLTNIASGTADNTKVIIDKGAIPIFIELLSSPKQDVMEQAVWALGNIAGDNANFRNIVTNAGIIEPLI
jgi:importin subunit alpha-1